MAMALGKTLTLTALFALPLLQCSHSDQMSSGELMRAALSDAQAETQGHAQACESATSLPPVMTDLNRHEDAMDPIIERMDEARLGMRDGMGMMHCTGESYDHMSQTVDDLDGELRGHSSRLREADLVGDAHTECASHTLAMDGMMHGIMSDLDSMECMRGR